MEVIFMDQNDLIEIIKHGTSYDEKRDIQEMYPICICPECMGVDTEVVFGIEAECNRRHKTGNRHTEKNGIFYREYYYVNYICNSCSCEWTKMYEDKKKRSTILSDKVRVGYLIIFILLTVLAIVSLACSFVVSENYPVDAVPWYLDLWAIGSTILFIIFFVCAIASFYEM
jgi:hypothetical protein